MKDFYNTTRLKRAGIFLTSLLGILFLFSTSAFASGNIILYTPSTEVIVAPGKTLNYNFQVLNNTSTVQDLPLYITGLSRDWSYNFQYGAWNLKRIAVLPGKKQILKMTVKVPQKINKGTYHFRVHAGLNHSISLTVIVSEKGTYKTMLTTNQANLQGHANSNFQFDAVLNNFTASQQQYALRAEPPAGWNVTFMSHYKDVTSVSVKPNTKADLEIKVKPPDDVKAGTYKIPVQVVSNNTSANTTFEVVIIGTYKMMLTTPTGRVSTGIVSGKQKRIELIVRNTGSSMLPSIKPSYQAPTDWKVTFDPKVITNLEPGTYKRLYATIKTSNDAIAGDYITKISALTPYVSQHLSFRVSVKTPMLWGWIGVLIIILALGLVYYLFRKYGRR